MADEGGGGGGCEGRGEVGWDGEGYIIKEEMRGRGGGGNRIKIRVRDL